MENDKFQNRYRIPSARASWHDYNGGEYFITICTAHRRHYFGEIRNGEMDYTTMGQHAVENLEQIKSHYPYCEIPLFVVMPNHIHAIVVIDGMANSDRRGGTNVTCGDSASTDVARRVSTNQQIAQNRGLLSTTIGGLKSALTKYANTYQIEFAWQTRFHDHIIRNQDEMNRIATYIERNPFMWKDDKFYTE